MRSEPGTYLNVDINVLPELTWNKKKYCLAFSCETTSFMWPYLLEDRSNLLQWFVKIHALVKTQFKRRVQRLRCDNEFSQDGAFVQFCENNGIILEPRPPYDANQNAKAERHIQTVMNMTRCTLDAARAPNSLWGECMLTCYVISNIAPTTANAQHATPWQGLIGSIPDWSMLRKWGCEVSYKINEPQNKLATRSERCMLVGFHYGQHSEPKQLQTLEPGTPLAIHQCWCQRL